MFNGQVYWFIICAYYYSLGATQCLSDELSSRFMAQLQAKGDLLTYDSCWEGEGDKREEDRIVTSTPLPPSSSYW